MEQCVVCKSTNLNSLENNYKYSSETFQKLFPDLVVKKCVSCGLIQVCVEDTEENNKKLFKYYRSDYRATSNIISLDDKNSLLYLRGEFISNMIAQYISDKSLTLTVFEKGCGFGFNLMHVKNKFTNSTLFTDEMDEHVKPHLKKIGVQLASWNGGGGYDVILMSHVLEHFTNPLEEIYQAYKNLKPGGLFYIEVPNSLNYVEPHITFWTDKSFLRMYGDYLADKFIMEDFGTWGTIFRFDEGVNGDFQKALVEQMLRGKISRAQAGCLKLPNGVYLRTLLRKRR